MRCAGPTGLAQINPLRLLECSGPAVRLELQSQVKRQADQERSSVWAEIWTSWPVATLFRTPDKLPVKVRQAARDVLAVQVIPERMREATCNLLAYHGEGQKGDETVRISLAGGRGWCGLSAGGGRPCPEVPRWVAVSDDAAAIDIALWETPVPPRCLGSATKKEGVYDPVHGLSLF